MSEGDSDQFTLTSSISPIPSPEGFSIADKSASSTPATENPTLRPSRSASDLTGPSSRTSRQLSGVATSVPIAFSGSPSATCKCSCGW